MKATDQPFSSIIEGNKQFKIPVFQRDYRWTSAQCAQLWTDLTRNHTADRGHFIGSIVCIAGEAAAAFGRWLVVDGQQRLTSLTLLMIALRDHIRSTGWTGADEDSPTPERIDAYFVQNMHQPGDRRYKLLLRRTDDATLRALVDESARPEPFSTLVVDAYEYFRSLVQDCDPGLIYREVSRLNVVDVTLDQRFDDPQQVFESLNSTGLDLGQSDLTRNYLLMRLDEPEQTRLYEKYWSNVERNFRGSDGGMDSFLRDYTALEIRTSRQIRHDRIYDTFKKTFDYSRGNDNLEFRIADIDRSAEHYAAFYVRPREDRPFADRLRRLRQHGDAAALLVMRLYAFHDSGALSTEDFLESLLLIESYLVRRAVCGLQTRNYWSVFAGIAFKLTNQSPFVDLKVALVRQDAYEFPSDVAFERALLEDDIYHRRICLYLLKQLENSGQAEVSRVDAYTIEHIMPQGLSKSWRDMLGPDWREIHKEWLHRLGNLTLTAYNSMYSNRPFEEKREMRGGFNESAVRLNKFVREQREWTVEQMRSRGRRLVSRALEIWPRVEVDIALVEEAEVQELRERAAARSPESLGMTGEARRLFGQLDERVRELGTLIVTVERKSACYYVGSSLVLEMLPQKWGVRLLLDIEYAEVDDSEELARDANDWKFIPNAAFSDWNVLVDVWGEEQIDGAVAIVRQALNLEASWGTKEEQAVEVT